MLATDEKKTIVLPSAQISEELPGIIFIRLHPGIHIDINHIKQINEAKNSIAGNRKYSVLFIPDITSSISKEAREHSAGKEVTKNAYCKAIVTKILGHRIIGNFFINFNQPSVPIRLFKYESDALNWIKSNLPD